MENIYKIDIRLEGIRPIMFDRYAGDNNTQLQPADKFYLDGEAVCIPAINIISMLTAENTKSVTKVFYPPKSGVKMRHSLNSFLMIEQEFIPLLDGNGEPILFNGEWTDKVFVHKSVARLAKGVPNPKERPCIKAPWSAVVRVMWMENPDIAMKNLEQIFHKCGMIGLGTFRPQFGQFRVSGFDVELIE